MIVHSPPATIQFHQRNVPVREIQVYAFAAGARAVLVKLPAGDGAERYFFVSYCRTHEVAWDPSSFGVCPACIQGAQP